MKACTVEIVTFTRGKRSRFASRGTFCGEADGFTAVYPEDGDEARLELRGRSLSMDRRGACGLHVRFSEGETGEFLIGLENGSGSVPVHTEVCAPRRTRDGWRIALRYRMLFADEIQIFRLNIAVNIITEEQ